MAESVAAREGRIDILVNNAGISGITVPLAEYPVEEWRRVLSIGLDGVFYCTVSKETLRYMVSKIPLGRMGKPQEVAALVAWLSSEQCSFSTGAVFDLSGRRATYWLGGSDRTLDESTALSLVRASGRVQQHPLVLGRILLRTRAARLAPLPGAAGNCQDICTSLQCDGGAKGRPYARPLEH